MCVLNMPLKPNARDLPGPKMACAILSSRIGSPSCTIRRGWRFGIHVQADVEVVISHFDGPNETFENAKCAFNPFIEAFHPVKLEEDVPQRRQQQAGQGLIFGGLNEEGLISLSFRFIVNSPQEDRLADPTQPDEKRAFLRTAIFDSGKGDLGVIEDGFTANQGRRRRSGAGRKGILDQVHL
jgi:hypothetical protein